MKRNYIGLANSSHDSGLAIVNSEGEVVFAEATERFMQNKRAFNIPPDVFLRTGELIKKYCDPDAELVMANTWSEGTADMIHELNGEIDRSLHALQAVFGAVPDFMDSFWAFNSFLNRSQLNAVSQAGRTVEYELSQFENRSLRKVIKRSYEHHRTHAAAACYTSPFTDGVCAILDGYGEGRAFSCYAYKDGKILDLPGMPKGGYGSLGAFYIFICDTCGFGKLAGEEWKVMGLAPYGKHDDELYALFREFIRVDGLKIEFCSESRQFQLYKKMHEIRRKSGEPPIAAANIAYAGQKVFTEVLFEYLNNLYDLGISENLIFGGGCALNSSANGQILENTKFKNLHVFSAPADDGNAIGAALLAFYEDHPERSRIPGFQSPYLGSSMSAETLENVQMFGGIPGLKTLQPEQTPVKAAELLAQGKIIGWVQGRAEFGPRALGNRSILADPRSARVKEQINARVKFREEFRPFAPSILHEFGLEYFENYQETPYMERTLRFKDAVKRRVPGVVHEDGTGRLQTVKQEWNPRYHKLIRSFYDLTEIPLVLNTSFNVMGKPIAHSVEDALAVFYTSGLDAIFIDDVLIEK